MSAYLTYDALIRSMGIPFAPRPMKFTDDIRDMTAWPKSAPQGWQDWYAIGDQLQ